MNRKAGLILSFLFICCIVKSISVRQLVDGKVETKLVLSPVE